MTQKEKQLLLQDICARLPYGVNIQVYYEELAGSGYFDETVWAIDSDTPFHVNDRWIENIKPYLRPMSSMTEGEKKEYDVFCCKPYLGIDETTASNFIDWLNKKMFDYRGLIPLGLAIEAPENLYKINNKIL